MIRIESIICGGRMLIHTYSDDNRYVVRDGISYEEAYDPPEFNRTYTEGDKIPSVEPQIEIAPDTTAEDILAILLGGAEE